MKIIAMRNVVKNGIYLLMVAAIVFCILFSRRNNSLEQISLEHIAELGVDRMMVTSNGK